MVNELKLIVLKPGEGQKVNLADMVQTMKATGEDTLGGFGMWESEIKGGPGPHIHRNEEEAFYVLEGEVEFRLGDVSEIMTTGGFALIPRGTVHAFKTLGEKPARLLVLASPAGFEHFFEEVAAMRAAGSDPYLHQARTLTTSYPGPERRQVTYYPNRYMALTTSRC